MYNDNLGIMDQIKSCTPAFAYFIVSLIMLLVGCSIALISGKFNISEICSQLCTIMVYTALFVFLCRYNMNIAWIIFIICALSFCSGIFGRLSISLGLLFG